MYMTSEANLVVVHSGMFGYKKATPGTKAQRQLLEQLSEM